MMKDKIALPVFGPSGDTTPWDLRCSESGDGECTITTADPQGTVWTGSGTDWFNALRSLRRDLDVVGYRPLCAGARKNARVSGMLSQMTRGETVYLLRPGRVPRGKAWIFDPADPADVGSVAQQDAFWEHWQDHPPGLFAGMYSSATSVLGDWYFRLRNR
jgi:hypothetical protein